MPQYTFKYTNNVVTVVWNPDTCIHSRICWTELNKVFDPTKRPRINISGSNTEKIINRFVNAPAAH